MDKKSLYLIVGILIGAALVSALFLAVSFKKTDYNTELLAGVQGNDKIKVVKALKNGADPNSIDNSGTSALVLAIKKINERNKDFSICQSLIDAGANVSEPEVIIAALRIATNGTYVGDFKYSFIPNLISMGADINAKVDGINDVFCYAVKHNIAYQIIKASAGAGANVNALIDNEYLPLEYTIRVGNHDIVGTLVRTGTKIPEEIDGEPLKEYVISRYGSVIVDEYYKSLFQSK